MRVFVIPDTHLKKWVFEEAEAIIPKSDIDQVVCLGDIVDDFGKKNDQKAYNEMCDTVLDFLKKYPNTKWCWGNHDISYIYHEEQSGTAYGARKAAEQCVYTLQDNIPEDNLQVAFKIDNVIFSHAGITERFVKRHILGAKFDDKSKKVEEEIDNLSMEEVVEKVNQMGKMDLWCDDSPIWERPQRYFNGYFYIEKTRMFKGYEYLQVVGHTPMETIGIEHELVSCDVFSTYRDGKPIGPQAFLIVDTVPEDGQYKLKAVKRDRNNKEELNTIYAKTTLPTKEYTKKEVL